MSNYINYKEVRHSNQKTEIVRIVKTKARAYGVCSLQGALEYAKTDRLKGQG